MEQRLRNLIEKEIGDCCGADVERRLAELRDLRETVPETITADVASLSTLGDETRYRIVRLLVAAEDELCVCELVPLLDVGESAISHALSDLAASGLVTRRKEGTWRYYAPTALAADLVSVIDSNIRAVA